MDYEEFEEVLKDFVETDDVGDAENAESPAPAGPEFFTTVVTLALTVVRDGAGQRHREFVATVTGTSNTHRPAYQALYEMRSDADKWLDSLDSPDHPRRIGMAARPRLTRWQRFVLTLARVDMPDPGRPVTVRPSRREVEAAEIGDGTQTHRATVRVTVDSLLFPEKAEQHGTTNASMVSLAKGLTSSVCTDVQTRLSHRYHGV